MFGDRCGEKCGCEGFSKLMVWQLGPVQAQVRVNSYGSFEGIELC